MQLELEDGTAYGITGHIDFLALTVDEETGTVALRAEFPNPGNLLLPGQFVRARIQAGTRPGGIVVPQRGVQVTERGGTVMVVGDQNVVELRQVRLGALIGANWVVLGGLNSGDRVIINGLQKARVGQPVRIAAPAAARAAASPASARQDLPQ